MPAEISTYSVKCALRPYVGSVLVDNTPVAEEAAHVLRSYAPYKDTLEALAKQVAEALFDVLYTALGPRMMLRLDDGRIVHLGMGELPFVADAAMGVLFDGMKAYSVNYQTLKDYSLRTGSLSAMRVLYQKYDEFQSAEEKALMARIIRGSHPRERYAAWLKDEA